MKKVILSLSALVLAMGMNAQLLWKVSGNGAKGDSYLFGTHHIAPVSTLDTTPGFSDALSSIDNVYGEVEMGDMTSPETQQMVLAIATAPADSTLSKVLTPEQIDSVNAVLKKYTGGMVSVAQLEAMKPSMIGTQLAMLQAMTAFPNYNPQQQLDTEVQTRGIAQGKGVKGFETIEQQLNWLMGDPIAEQAENLMDEIRKDGTSIEQAKALAQAYTEADIDKITQIMFDAETGMSPETVKRLLYDRNDNWIAELKEILPNENVLVTVGIGHLIGEKGLIAQLRNLGYTVTPVK